jgi:AmmeMemoRadiSam system protein A
MSDDQLTSEERLLLLQIARNAVESAVNGQELPELEISAMPLHLQEQGASFVTLTLEGNLRGCIGALQASQSLALDVQEHAVAAAMEDYRFKPVLTEEVGRIEIEISRLSPSKELEYSNPNELLSRLRPGVDGVVLRHGFQRATFLPQVWEKVPDTADFLTQLCYKMGALGDLWKREHIQVSIYQVEEFKEEKRRDDLNI